MELETERLVELARAACDESRRLRRLIADDLWVIAKQREAARGFRERAHAERLAMRQNRGLPRRGDGSETWPSRRIG